MEYVIKQLQLCTHPWPPNRVTSFLFTPWCPVLGYTFAQPWGSTESSKTREQNFFKSPSDLLTDIVLRFLSDSLQYISGQSQTDSLQMFCEGIRTLPATCEMAASEQNTSKAVIMTRYKNILCPLFLNVSGSARSEENLLSYLIIPKSRLTSGTVAGGVAKSHLCVVGDGLHAASDLALLGCLYR